MNSQIQPTHSRFSGRAITAIVLLAIGGFLALLTLVGMTSDTYVYDRTGAERNCSTVNPVRPNASSGTYGDARSMLNYRNASNLAKVCEQSKDQNDAISFFAGFLAVVFLVPGVMLLLKNKKTNAPYGPPVDRFPGPVGPASGGYPGPVRGGNPGPGQV